MSPEMPLLLLHSVVTWLMCGVIWFVQVVHYPLFAQVGRGGFELYEQEHARRTTWVVAPLMILEVLSGLALLSLTNSVPLAASITGLVLLAIIWASTAWGQVPRHRVLARGFDRSAHTSLVRGNWLRTVAWSLRALLVMGMLLYAANAQA